MTLKEIKDGLPEELINQLIKNEKVYYFSYISTKGGCFSSSSKEEHWIALTNTKVIYKGKVKENVKMEEMDGMLPFDKISFIQVSEKKESSCCSSTNYYLLEIGTSGKSISIALPTKEKCQEVRKVYSEILENSKKTEV